MQLAMPPLTPVVRVLIFTCAGVFAVQYLLSFVSPEAGAALSGFFGISQSLWREWLPFVPVWQLLTWGFLHGDFMHILMNMMFLYFFGTMLEGILGSRRFLVNYAIALLVSGIVTLVVGLIASTSAPTVGASGAVYGIILAFGKIFSERVILFMLIFPMRARTFAWVMFAVTFVFTLQSSSSAVSHVAHLGGMIVGYLYLKRAWRLRPFIDEIRWKMRRRKFKVMPPKDDDWIH